MMPRRFAGFPWRRQGYASSARPAADLAASPAGAAPGARQATPHADVHPDVALLLSALADEEAMVLQLREAVRQVRDARRLMQAERDHWRRLARERALTIGELRRQLAATLEAKR